MNQQVGERTFTQRAGVRGWWAEIAMFLVYVPIAFVWVRSAPSTAWVVGVAAAAIVVRLVLFHGPHRRGVTVTSSAVRYGRTVLPLADVRSVLVTELRELRRGRDLDQAFDPPGPREAIVLDLLSPEGIDASIGFAVDDARGLADEILARRPAAPRPPMPRPPVPLPYAGHQGLSRVPAGLLLLPAIVLDLVSMLTPGGVMGATLVVGGLLLYMARRPVRVDDVGVRVGRSKLSWDEIASVRCVTYGEVMQLPRQHQQAPPWGPPFALVVVRRPRPGEGETPPRSRTYVLGVSDPIDVNGTSAPPG